MHTLRRLRFHDVALALVAMLVAWTDGRSPQAAETPDLAAARVKAAHRQRRIIYNNDGDDVWAEGADTAAKFLALRHEPLLGTQVDSIFYCTTQSFNLFSHDSKVAEVFLSREGTFAHNHLQTFLDRKTDPLRMSCAFAREHRLETIWTLRMNDIHDAWTPQFVSQWEKADPARIMSTLEQTKGFNDRRRLWSLVDFEHEDVEPRLIAIIEEVLRNYPVDGVELDFLRAPFYFRTAYDGQPVTPNQAQVLTRIVTNIRKMVLREGERQGKPFLLTARVPVSVELCRKIGIDIRGWLATGLLDVLAVGGGYVVFDQPVKELIDLGHRHNVPVYPCISLSGLLYRDPRGKGESQPPAAWNGAASRFWEAGADGIYVFNLFPGPGPKEQHDHAVEILRTIGTKEILGEAERLFAVCDAGWSMPAHYWAKDAESFGGALPTPLNSKSPTTVPLAVAGPIALRGAKAATELRLDFAGLSQVDHPSIRLNARPLGKPTRSEVVAGVRRLQFTVPPDVARTGTNEIRVDPLSDQAKLAGAELWIRNAAAGPDFIPVRNPKVLPARIPAERIAVGHPGDYKPCLALLPTGELLLVTFVNLQVGGGKVREDISFSRSLDGGKTWSGRRVVPLLGREPYFSVLRDGTLFLTTHLLDADIRNKDGYIHSYVHRSTDGGASWTTLRIGAENVPGAAPKTWTHTSRNVLELQDGSLILGVSAGSSIDYLWRSRDRGKTWDPSLACKVEGFDVKKQGFPWHAETFFSQAPNGDLLAIARCFSGALPTLSRSAVAKGGDEVERMALFRSRDGGGTWRLQPEMGNDYGEHYQALLRLQDGRMLLTFTVRSLRPPLGVQAVLGVERNDGFILGFKQDRLVLDDKTPVDQPSGGGFGNTVQLKDGTLVTAYTFRGADGKSHPEVVRWKLPGR